MEFVGSIPYYVVVFFVGIGVLIFVHELGHYLAARWCNVRVEVFSIGFGPEIWGITDKIGTRWKFSAVPFGGYVKMFGEQEGRKDKDKITEEEKAFSFGHKSLAQRAFVVAAGPVANIIFTIIVFAGLFSVVGSPGTLAGIGTVQENSAAASAGLLAGDRILEINGRKIKWFNELRDIVAENPGKLLEFIVLRNGTEIVLTVTPQHRKSSHRVIGFLGVTPDTEQVKTEFYGPLKASWLAVEKTWTLTGQIFSAIGQIIIGQSKSDELGGPLMIGKILGDVAQMGIDRLVFIVAVLSLNLGLINLFPVPILDGGHLLLYVVEAIRGRPLSEKAQEYSSRFGLMLILALMLFATWNDLVNLEIVKLLKDFVT